MPDEEEYSKFLLQLVIDVGDDEDALARFRKTGVEILTLSGVWNYHKGSDADNLAAVILSEMVEWITFERQTTLLIAFRKLLAYAKEKGYGPEEFNGLLEYLEESFAEMREVWKRTGPDPSKLIPPEDEKN